MAGESEVGANGAVTGRRVCRVRPPGPGLVLGRERDLPELKTRLGIGPRGGGSPLFVRARPDEIRRLRAALELSRDDLVKLIRQLLKQLGLEKSDEFSWDWGRRIEIAEDRKQRNGSHRTFFRYLAQVLGVPPEQLIAGDSDGDARFVVMKGWPGVGKTTLLRALGNDDLEVPAAFPDGVLWTTIGPDPDFDPREALLGWCDAVGGGPDEEAPGLHGGRVEQLTGYLRGKLHDRRVLLLFDDVWFTSQLDPFRVGGPRCATLVTTRRDDVARDLSHSAGDVMTLGNLSAEDGRKLLKSLAPKVEQEFPNECARLVADLEGLPLALQVAGRVLHAQWERGGPVKRLFEEFIHRSRILRERPPANLDPLIKRSAPTVAALLELSTNLLSGDDRRRFALLGVQPPKPATFDRELMADIWETSDPDPTINVLADLGLIQPVNDPESGETVFEMHALLVLLAGSLLSKGRRA